MKDFFHGIGLEVFFLTVTTYILVSMSIIRLQVSKICVIRFIFVNKKKRLCAEIIDMATVYAIIKNDMDLFIAFDSIDIH